MDWDASPSCFTTILVSLRSLSSAFLQELTYNVWTVHNKSQTKESSESRMKCEKETGERENCRDVCCRGKDWEQEAGFTCRVWLDKCFSGSSLMIKSVWAFCSCLDNMKDSCWSLSILGWHDLQRRDETPGKLANLEREVWGWPFEVNFM